MKQLDIADLQWKRNNYRYLAHLAPTGENWTIFRNLRNELISKIKETKTEFCEKILS